MESYITDFQCQRMLVISPDNDYYQFNVSWTLLPHVASTRYIMDFSIEQEVLEIVNTRIESVRASHEDLSVPFIVSGT